MKQLPKNRLLCAIAVITEEANHFDRKLFPLPVDLKKTQCCHGKYSSNSDNHDCCHMALNSCGGTAPLTCQPCSGLPFKASGHQQLGKVSCATHPVFPTLRGAFLSSFQFNCFYQLAFLEPTCSEEQGSQVPSPALPFWGLAFCLCLSQPSCWLPWGQLTALVHRLGK